MHPPSLNTTMLRIKNKAMADRTSASSVEPLRIDANKYSQSASTQSIRQAITESVATHRSEILGALARQALIAEAEKFADLRPTRPPDPTKKERHTR